MNLQTIKDAIATWVENASGLPVLWGGKNAPRPAGDVPYIELRLRSMPDGGSDWVDLERNVLTFADAVIEAVDTIANTLTITGHDFETGDGPVRVPTTGTRPAPLTDVDYWIIVVDEDTIQLATNFPRAIAAVPTPIDLTSAGTGVNTIIDQPTTMRAGEEAFYRVRGTRVPRLTMQCFANPDPTAADTADPMAVLSKVRALSELPPHCDNLNTAGIGLGEFAPIIALDGLIGATYFEPRASLEVPLNLMEEESAPAQIIERTELEIEADGISIGTVYTPDDPDA